MLADYFELDLTEELNLDSLPKEKKQKLVEQMTDTVTARLNHAFLDRLNAEQKQKLDKVIENDGDVMGFIRDNVANADMIAAEIISKFKQEAAELQADIRQRVQAASN